MSTAGAAAPRAAILAFLAVALLGAVRVLPDLKQPVWQDEAATLMAFASRGVAGAFGDYSMPNNHMLFSAALAAWWSPGDDTERLRLLPLAAWLATLGGFAFVTRHLGLAARTAALALFCGASLAPAFALQLRGYAFSWPFALLALGAAALWVVEGRRLAAVAFVAAVVALVAILPSNALVGAIAAAWAGVLGVTTRDARPGAVTRAAFALGASVAALAIYLPHREQLATHATASWSPWSEGAVLVHWLQAAGGEYLALLPLVVLGAALALRPARAGGRYRVDPGLALLGVLLAGIVAVLWVLPKPPFPRMLVPLLPLWCLALGALLWRGAADIARRLPPLPSVAAVLAAMAAFALPWAMPSCGGEAPERARHVNLCAQYYRGDYRPLGTLDYLLGDESVAGQPVMGDSEAAWALGFLLWNARLTALHMVEYRAWRSRVGDTERPRIVVNSGLMSVDAMLERIGMEPPAARELLHSEGFFTIWSLRWPETARVERKRPLVAARAPTASRSPPPLP